MEKIIIVYNPVSGKNATRPSLESIRRQFSVSNYEVDTYTTKCTGDAIDFVKNNAAKYDKILSCGGDGTLNEVVNGLLQAGVSIPVAYMPQGSTNDFAQTLKVPSDYRTAAGVAKIGDYNEYDVGKINDRYFNYVACFGPGASISYATPQPLKNKLGYSAYMLNGFLFSAPKVIKELKPKKLRIEFNGQVIEDYFYYGALSNSTSVAGLFKFQGQHIVLNDGKFELLLVKKFKPLNALPLLIDTLKGNFENDDLVFVKTDSLKLTFLEEDVPWTFDGEFAGDLREIDFTVAKKAIKICSPKNELFE